jgi:hypothetical protein
MLHGLGLSRNFNILRAVPTTKLLHDICWIFCMQRCIPVDVLFILKLKFIVLYTDERVVLGMLHGLV